MGIFGPGRIAPKFPQRRAGGLFTLSFTRRPIITPIASAQGARSLSSGLCLPHRTGGVVCPSPLEPRLVVQPACQATSAGSLSRRA